MKHLFTFEELDLDKYNQFLDKYKKSTYISKSSDKILKELGFNFYSLQKKVSNCYGFFNIQDIETLRELLLYAKDDCPVVVDYDFIWFSLQSFPRSLSVLGNLEKFTTAVSVDDNGLPSKGGKKLDDQINMIDSIITTTDRHKNDMISKYIKRSEEDLDKRPGKKDWFNKTALDRVNRTNHYDNMEINPIISIQFDFSFKEINYAQVYADAGIDVEEDVVTPNLNWRETNDRVYKIERDNRDYKYKIVGDFNKYLIDEIFERYFAMVGLNGKFEVSNNFGYNSYGLITFNIKYIIDQKIGSY